MEDFDTIVNWTNKLGNSYNTKFIQACAEAENLKEQGYTKEEAEEMLASTHGLKGLREILSQVFGTVKNQKLAQEAFVVPTGYDDITHVVETNLLKDGPETFISDLTDTEFPIIEASKSYKATLLKLAKSCYENNSLMKHLHNEIKPYFEEAMLNAVLKSEQQSSSIKKANAKEYQVKIGGKSAMVNLMDGISNNEIFTKGNYSKFGLADEFLVKAHDEVSPYTRILKVLSD